MGICSRIRGQKSNHIVIGRSQVFHLEASSVYQLFFTCEKKNRSFWDPSPSSWYLFMESIEDFLTNSPFSNCLPMLRPRSTCMSIWPWAANTRVFSSILAFFLEFFYESYKVICCCCSIAKLCPPLQSHGLQHTRLPCPSLSPRVC